MTLESDSVAFSSIAWSPDGKLIAFFSEKEEDQDNIRLKIISVNDGDSRVVAKVQDVGIHNELAWSPDSKRIAFNGPEDMIIKVISINDGSIEDIKTDLVDVNIYHFDWLPDGSKFVFGGWQGGNAELWIMEDFLPLVKQTK